MKCKNCGSESARCGHSDDGISFDRCSDCYKSKPVPLTETVVIREWRSATSADKSDVEAAAEYAPNNEIFKDTKAGISWDILRRYERHAHLAGAQRVRRILGKEIALLRAFDESSS